MTDHEINVAIAEHCGWTWDFNDKKDVFWMNKSKPFQTFRYPPSYASDLNAMHEAEKVLEVGFDGSPADDYQQALWSVVNQFIPWISSEDNQPLYDVGYLQNFIHATARQRAEAFLRTLGKWVEPKR